MRNENDTSRYTAAELETMRRRGEDRTDDTRLDAMRDADIEAQAAEEPAFDWTTAEVGLPPAKRQLTMRLDEDVIAWFRAQGTGYQTRMNAVLRCYMEAHKSGSR